MKRLPLGIQNFREIINDGHVYVDKTQYIYRALEEAKYYFLSRPRRFGKSLLLDTIAEVFSGNKELFKGLWIYGSDYEFAKHPVLRLDMSTIANKTPETLESELSIELMRRAREEGFDIDYGMPSTIFKVLIEALHVKYGRRVVILIDEYDKPILDHVDDIKMASANRKVVKGFYGILKGMDPHIRLTFMTGVSRFTKTSVFSELNNMLDITMSEQYANICGIAVEDLGKYFGEHIEALAPLKRFKQLGSVHDEILAWYDGYSWDGETRVLNPFSLLSFFMQKRFSGFWYSSGTPAFLMNLIRKDPSIYAKLDNLWITEGMLDSYELDRIDGKLLLFQAGYLTVKELRLTGGADEYLLGIPNFEVREAFNLHVLGALAESGQPSVKGTQLDIIEALSGGDLQQVLALLRALFASIPYQLHVKEEAYYHSLFIAVLNVLGLKIEAEVSVSGGSVDAVLELEDKVYVMEFKYMGCAPDATQEEKDRLYELALSKGMGQIKDKGYAKRYSGTGKAIYLTAFAFLGRDDIEMRTEQQ